MSVNDNYEFRVAALNGDAISVRKMLETSSVVSNISARDNEAFRFAAKYGYIEIVKILLSYPAVVSDISIRDNEAITWAAEQGQLEVVKCILEYINQQEYPDLLQDIIKAAATFNYTDMLFYALKESAYRYAFDALLFAAIHGHLPLVKLLLDLPEVKAIAHHENNQILNETVLRGHLNIVNLLLEISAVQDNVAAYNNFAFRAAVFGGHVEIMHCLLKFSPVQENVAAQNNYAFRAAVHFACNIETLGYDDYRNFLAELYIRDENDFIDNVIDERHISYSLTDSLYFQGFTGNPLAYKSILNSLLAFPEILANMAAANNSALKSAAKGGDLAFVEFLLKCPIVIANIHALVEQYDISGGIPTSEYHLFWLEAKNVAVIQRLLTFPAVNDGLAKIGNYALQAVATLGDLQAVNDLLQSPTVVSNIGEVVWGIEVHDGCGCDPHFDMNWLRRDNLDVVKKLLSFPEVRKRILTSCLTEDSKAILLEIRFNQ